MHGQVVETYPIVSVMLPRPIEVAIKVMAELLTVYEPRFSLCLGPFADGGRTLVPRAAVNAAAILPLENQDASAPASKVVLSDVAAYSTRLPVESICRSLGYARFPAEAGALAGEGVSNGLLFGMLHYMHTFPALLGSEGGLIRLPHSPHLAPSASDERLKPMDCWLEVVTQVLATTAIRSQPVTAC